MKTSLSSPKCCLNFWTAEWVYRSSPYPTTWPWLAAEMAFNTSGWIPALLSLAKLRAGFMAGKKIREGGRGHSRPYYVAPAGGRDLLLAPPREDPLRNLFTL